MRAVYSGPLTDGEKFERFNRWFSQYHGALPCELYPRDFMWYNERIGAQEQFYVLPQGADEREIPGYEIVNSPGGLFTEMPVPLFTALLSVKCKAAYQGHKKRKDNLV